MPNVFFFHAVCFNLFSTIHPHTYMYTLRSETTWAPRHVLRLQACQVRQLKVVNLAVDRKGKMWRGAGCIATMEKTMETTTYVEGFRKGLDRKDHRLDSQRPPDRTDPPKVTLGLLHTSFLKVPIKVSVLFGFFEFKVRSQGGFNAV